MGIPAAARTRASTGNRKCHHCGIAFRPRHESDQFCCAGCRVVHDLIQGEGFSDFYSLLGSRSLAPLNEQPMQRANLEWLEEMVEQGRTEVTVKVANLSCTACVWLIERLFRRQKGAIEMRVDTSRATLFLRWQEGVFDPVAFAVELHRFGYPVSELSGEEADAAASSESRALLTRLGVTAGLAMNTMAFSLPAYLGLEPSDELAGLFRMVAFGSSTLALAVGGSCFFQKALLSLRTRVLHIDVPISLGLLVAWVGSFCGYLFGLEDFLYFDFVATFVTLMLLGRWLQVRMIEYNRAQIQAREVAPISIRRRVKEANGEVASEPIQPDKIAVGDTLEIASRTMIPVKGLLISDRGSVSMDWINGEPEPVSLEKGDEIPAGSRNVSEEPLVVLAEDGFRGTLVEKLINSEVSAESDEGTYNTSILQWYLLVVIAVAVAGFTGWWIESGDIARSLQVLISVLVVSCPCAIGIALPLVDEKVNFKMRKLGVFVRRNRLWRNLSKVRHLVFDKTGTLTEPSPRWLNPDVVIEGLDEKAREVLLFLTEKNFHPHSVAVREVLISRFGIPSGPEGGIEKETEISSGVSCEFDGDRWCFGKQSWATGREVSVDRTVFTRNGEVLAIFEIGESVRAGARDEIDRLHRNGLDVTILSGDPDRDRVNRVGEDLGIPGEKIRASLSANAKADYLAEHDGARTLFVGDGGNDGLAFEQALSSGAPATGIRAIENRADFVFLDRNFRAVGRVLEAAGRRRRIVQLIFATAVVYNLFAVTLCLAGLMNPLLAAVLMPISSLVTTAMASRV